MQCLYKMITALAFVPVDQVSTWWDEVIGDQIAKYEVLITMECFMYED